MTDHTLDIIIIERDKIKSNIELSLRRFESFKFSMFTKTPSVV